MTYQGDFTLPTELLEQIAANGFDQPPELIRVVINAAMQAERQQYLGAAPYQRNLSGKIRLTATSPKQSRRGWEKSPSKCHKCAQVVSTRKRSRKAYAVNGHLP